MIRCVVVSCLYIWLQSSQHYTEVMWDVAPCSPVDINRRFRGVYSLYHQATKWPHPILF
jgi:hypothetical protein